jgi:hypothetical protein
MMKKIKKVIKKKKETAAKMIAPKAVTALTNIVRMGPRIIFRSTVELLKANLITRIISCLSLLVIDIIDLVRKRISKAQFIKNVILSALLVLSGTLGWELGTLWLSVELAGIIVVEVIVGIIGAGILSFSTNWVACKIADKYIKSDADQMLDIIDPLISDLSKEEQEFIREHITLVCLKKMYASDDRYAYGLELVNKLKNHEKLEGTLKPPHHKAALN